MTSVAVTRLWYFSVSSFNAVGSAWMSLLSKDTPLRLKNSSAAAQSPQPG